MVTTDAILGKVINPQQNNYSGVKISIHNPTVNVPNTQPQLPQQAQPEFRIYQYDNASKNIYPQPYFPKNTPVVALPSSNEQPVRDKKVILDEIKVELDKLQDVIQDLPASVLSDVKVVKVPEPVFMEEELPACSQTTVNEPVVEQPNMIAEAPVNEPVDEQPNVIAEAPVNEPVDEQPNVIAEAPVVVAEEVPSMVVQAEPKAVEPAIVEETSEVQEESVVAQVAPVEELQQAQVVQDAEPVNAEKAEEVKKSSIEIIPPMEKASAILDYEKVTKNLQSANYDIQALQLRDIGLAAVPNSPIPLKHYVTEQNFLDVIDIVSKDASNLAGPTEAQIQIRAKIIENYIAKLNQPDVPEKDVVYPHNLTEQDVNYANALSPRELVERNREYAIVTLAVMSKYFTDRVEESTGTVVPITDVPGMAALVNSLKNENFVIRLAALDSLQYLHKAEYANELRPIYEALVNTDSDENVKRRAADALNNLESLVQQSTANAA